MDSNTVNNIILPIVLGVVSSAIYALLVAGFKALRRKRIQINAMSDEAFKQESKHVLRRAFIAVSFSIVVYTFIYVLLGLPFDWAMVILIGFTACFNYVLAKDL